MTNPWDAWYGDAKEGVGCILWIDKRLPHRLEEIDRMLGSVDAGRLPVVIILDILNTTQSLRTRPARAAFVQRATEALLSKVGATRTARLLRNRT